MLCLILAAKTKLRGNSIMNPEKRAQKAILRRILAWLEYVGS